jgi:transposase
MLRHELSDEQWLRISALLPRHGRRPLQGDRNLINSVLYLMKTGCPWRDLPERYGKWKTIYNCFANGSRAGHFESIFKALRVTVDNRGSLLDFHTLKSFRRIATRHEKTVRNYLAIVHLACALQWLK